MHEGEHEKSSGGKTIRPSQGREAKRQRGEKWSVKNNGDGKNAVVEQEMEM